MIPFPLRTSFCAVALAIWCTGLASVFAQPAISATPVDPTQPVPAQPVDPNQPVPAQPAVPSSASPTPVVVPVPAVPSSTNAVTSGTPAVAISILADSSLRNVLQELAQTWADSQTDGPEVPLTLTNAGTMRTQLSANPTWDVVISADLDGVKVMTDEGLLAPEGQRTLARNTVVIYGRSAIVKDDALDWFDLVGTQWKKIAMGNPDLVQSGRVAKHALQKHDLFDGDHKNLFTNAGNETLALGMVESDQADAAFVYRSDLKTIQLPGFDIFPLTSDDAPPVFYTAALGRLAKNPQGAAAFINYCTSEAARDIWIKYGFEMD